MISGHNIVTVRDEIEISKVGICDAHNHIWINPVEILNPEDPVLNQLETIKDELVDYKNSGANSIVDCQPGGCERDGDNLRFLSDFSGVNIIACTGFHLQRYYPPDYWLFRTGVEQAVDFFIEELEGSIVDVKGGSQPIRAGLIKIACEEKYEKSPVQLIEAAVSASMQTGAPIECYTERGFDAEKIADEILKFGLTPRKLILCHLDKRPDFDFHESMMDRGIMLEYDTFYREKYNPEENVWPLLENMMQHGYGSNIVLATDMADARMWNRFGGGPGLVGFITEIRARLVKMSLEKKRLID
jgi:phosphotriesterase-related protein